MTMYGASYVLNLFEYAMIRLQFAHVHAPLPPDRLRNLLSVVLLLVLPA